MSYKYLWAGIAVGLALRRNGPCQDPQSSHNTHITHINLAMKAVNVPNAMGGDESAAPEPIVIKHFHPKEGT